VGGGRTRRKLRVEWNRRDPTQSSDGFAARARELWAQPAQRLRRDGDLDFGLRRRGAPVEAEYLYPSCPRPARAANTTADWRRPARALVVTSRRARRGWRRRRSASRRARSPSISLRGGGFGRRLSTIVWSSGADRAVERAGQAPVVEDDMRHGYRPAAVACAAADRRGGW
jgi:hypothetical protein